MWTGCADSVDDDIPISRKENGESAAMQTLRSTSCLETAVVVSERDIPDYRKSSGPDLSNVPAELRSYKNFVGWKYEELKKKDETVKISKVPYVVGDHGRHASSTNPATWTTYAEASEHACNFNGIGFSVHETPFCGFDFDHCRNKQTGEIQERFRRYIQKLNSYTEVTPSGEGVRVWVIGTLSVAARNEFRFTDESSVEIYDSGRYFTLTGNHLEGTPVDIRVVDIRAIHLEITADLKQDEAGEDEAGEEERLERIVAGTPAHLFVSANGTKLNVEDFLRRHAIEILRTKRHGNSIVYEIECQGSHGGYDRHDGKAFVKVFPSGGIFYGCHHKTCSHNNNDNHWRELRERYEPQTYKDDPGRQLGRASQEGETSELIIVRGDEVAEKATTWMWRRYLPLGTLVHFGGNSSQAKSPVTIDLAARISVGASWPDGQTNDLGPRSVIVLNIEDNFEETILPRFRLAGGDKTKIYAVKGTRIFDSKKALVSERSTVINRDIGALRKCALGIPDLALILIDPITNYLGGIPMNKEEEIRAGILTPIAKLAADLGIVSVTVGHLNRRERGTDPLHRMMGCAAFAGVARSVYSFGPDPDDSDKYAHVMTVVRACGGDGTALRYRTEMVRDAAPDCPANDIIRVVWRGTSNATAEDAVDPESRETRNQEAEAADLIKEFLREPPHRKPTKECEQFLTLHGFNIEEEGKAKLNVWRIRKQAGVKTKKFPKEKWYSWYLEVPPDQQEFNMGSAAVSE